MPEPHKTESKAQSPVQGEAQSAAMRGADPDFDLDLLLENLKKSPWERMQANDDALRLVEMLQNGLKHAES